MMKKIISCLLIISLLSYLGCSGTNQIITKKEFVKGYTEENDRSGIYVTTNDSTLYEFEENRYEVKSDTLYGAGKLNKSILQGIVSNWIVFNGKIALKDMMTIEKVYTSSTYAIIGVILIAGILLWFVISKPFPHSGFWGKK